MRKEKKEKKNGFTFNYVSTTTEKETFYKAPNFIQGNMLRAGHRE